MKILLFCKLSFLFILVLLPQSAFAQDYKRWGCHCRKAPRRTRASARVDHIHRAMSRIHRMERDSLCAPGSKMTRAHELASTMHAPEAEIALGCSHTGIKGI